MLRRVFGCQHGGLIHIFSRTPDCSFSPVLGRGFGCQLCGLIHIFSRTPDYSFSPVLGRDSGCKLCGLIHIFSRTPGYSFSPVLGRDSGCKLCGLIHIFSRTPGYSFSPVLGRDSGCKLCGLLRCRNAWDQDINPNATTSKRVSTTSLHASPMGLNTIRCAQPFCPQPAVRIVRNRECFQQGIGCPVLSEDWQ